VLRATVADQRRSTGGLCKTNYRQTRAAGSGEVPSKDWKTVEMLSRDLHEDLAIVRYGNFQLIRPLLP
jgi:hypothetical protein